MKVIDTKLNGLRIIENEVFHDNRGFFMESYSQEKFSQHQINCNFIQDNYSQSLDAGVIRGLHYQLNPKAQTKLIYVVSGEIYDVAVDIRKHSLTYGQWFGIVLSAENKRQLLIPKGFAHGYCTMAPNTKVIYKVDEYYSPEHERGILWNDPSLSIDWPTGDHIISEKDKLLPLFDDIENDFK